MTKFNRRNFLGAFGSGLFGLGLNRKMIASETQPNFRSGQESELKIKKYNPLGKTGLKVSDVSCGAISFFEPNVLRYALDLGVNYFDTAEGYMNKKSESFIGQALSDVRDKVIITTKHNYSRVKPEDLTKSHIINRMEESLKRLKTDYVDVALVHDVGNLDFLKQGELLAAYEQLQKSGKIRFKGFSTHNAPVTLKQALNVDFADVVLVIYNHTPEQGKAIEPLIKQVRENGMGVIAMKIFAGGKQGNLKSMVSQNTSYPQAAIRWILSNSNVDCCIPTMSSYSHVEEYVAASGQPLNREDIGLIAEYQRQASNLYCRVGCDECHGICPDQVEVNDVLRFNMYFDDYKMEKEAMRYYSEMDERNKPLKCSNCSGMCTQACPYGLNVREKLIRAHEVLSA
ncbi:aldo/keto reductase [Acidobacteriota bacterium]